MSRIFFSVSLIPRGLIPNISIKESVIRLPGRKGKYQPDNELENNFWFFVDTQEMSKYLNLNLVVIFS